MNSVDKQYTALLRDILDNGVRKEDRTGTGTLSVFGRQIRHKMSDGFPLLTTKKMPFRLIATELMWFLRGDTNIKYLVDNDCHIWDGDAYKNFCNSHTEIFVTQEEFIERIKDDNEFAQKWGDLGPVYGKQWRSWETYEFSVDNDFGNNEFGGGWNVKQIDQIANLIRDLKTNPDSRRLMVSAWNVAELDSMTLPPCHYGFQVYTRELSLEDRIQFYYKSNCSNGKSMPDKILKEELKSERTVKMLDKLNIPTRAISLMWNQRSVDTFLGLPFNIASYGLLLEIIATAVNMVPDELIGNLGDTHLYLNHVEQAKEQIGRELSLEERRKLWVHTGMGWKEEVSELLQIQEYNCRFIPKRTREPYLLPTLNINTEWWPTESGECGVGPIDAAAVVAGFSDDNFCRCLVEEDIQLSNYQSHPSIKAPLSN